MGILMTLILVLFVPLMAAFVLGVLHVAEKRGWFRRLFGKDE